jgi:LPS-assembly protein
MTGRAYFGRFGSSMVNRGVIAALAAGLAAAVSLGDPGPARGQTLSDTIAKKTAKSGEKKDKLVVESKELVYDKDKNTVSAEGNAQLYYQGRVLEADKVTYDRNTNRVYAVGNAKLTEADGQVVYGEKFELTDDFKDGFIDSLHVVTAEKTRFSAPRAERTSGETTVFEKGTYTACEPCKDDPSKPPLWQVRAKRIIHKNEERTVYYEDATLELYGMPIAWFPYFSTPDPTVKRKTGFLAPRYIASTNLGYGAATPFFWAIAPDKDLTLTPTFLTRQGVLGTAEWRQRLVNGSYNIRASGIFQQDPTAFYNPPYGAGNKTGRGSIESAGKFLINDKWSWGWDVTMLSDKWFLQNYKYHTSGVNVSALTTGFREAVSTLYLTGQGERSYFDARGYYFQGLSYTDWQREQPLVAPVIDYDRRFNGPSFLGGEVRLTANATNTNRLETDYYSLINANGLPGTYQFPVLYNGQPAYIYNTCAPGNYNPSKCLVRGAAGDYTRVTAEAAWRRTFIDDWGQSWTPFASVRGDMAALALKSTGYYNQYLPNFINTEERTLGRFMPVVGGTYRYPFVMQTSYGTGILEPIAQLIVRPNETQIGNLPNEDAQSFVYDDTNLFSVNKFSGYDRVEGGTRANYGLQYSLYMDKGAFASVLFGQSYQIAGRNSFDVPDLVRTGFNSGLNNSAGDYVGRIMVSPFSGLSVTARGRFDQQTMGLKRIEVQANATIMNLQTSLMFAHYAAQPLLGQYVHQEGLSLSAKYNFTSNIYAQGTVQFDLSRNSTEQFYIANGNPQSNYVPSLAALTVATGYQDECTNIYFYYTNSGKLALADGSKERVQSFMLRLELKTLGGAKYSYNETALSTDGIAR